MTNGACSQYQSKSGIPVIVGSWRDIVQVAAGGYFTLGLKSDGRVVAVGYNDNGETNVFDWEMISPHAMTKTTFLPLKDQYIRK